MSDLSVDFLASLEDMEQEQGYQAVISALPTSVTPKADARSIQEILNLISRIEKENAEQGTLKWFEDPYGIETLPKHKAFFDASAKYNEICFLAANR